jgi:UDP-N-acetylmuramate dehydrogenase
MIDIDIIKHYFDRIGTPHREDVTGSECTSFRTGGRIASFVYPENASQAAAVFDLCRKGSIPFFVIGNGSNLLIPDEGLDMVFVRLSGELTNYRIEGKRLICGAGASLAAVSKYTVYSGLSGLEWAAGIPGTVGGAVAMNAGAYGGEVKQRLVAVTVYNDGKLEKLEVTDDSMGYRRSLYSFPNMIVLEAEFALDKDDGSAKQRMDDYNERRRSKQPLNYPSAGSTFKRPEGHFAGALIEQAGLKGTRIGGAEVSEKHAGFIINRGGATSNDVTALIKAVEQTVFEKYGVWLEPEVKIL